MWVLSWLEPTHDGAWRCPQSAVTVHASDPAMAPAACEAAATALDFLQAQGLTTADPVEVHLMPQLPAPCVEHSFGCYEHALRRINMLTASACLAVKTLDGLALDPAVCNSLLAHEVAHAVAADNFTVHRPSLLAQEYVANVTMIASLPPAQRERLLALWHEAAFESADQISTTYYLMQPSRFSVKAYRHFMLQDDRPAFIQKVLTGELLGQDD